MHFANHSELEGLHATLSPSSYHWINYDEEKLDIWFANKMDAYRGTQLHALAHQLITLRQSLPPTGQTLNSYVNDALGFRMSSEVILVYSDNCYGTADTIKFLEEELFLRIHDLKNGAHPASMKQLIVYAAIFCLEYHFRPSQLNFELRIYQNDEIEILNSLEDIDLMNEITRIMDVIVTSDRRIEELKAEALS